MLKYIAQDPYEKFHMKYIEWSLSVHSKSSNIGCCGETGRHPLIYEACKLAIDYYERVERSDNPILSAAFQEQVSLDLQWHSNISNIIEKYNIPPPTNIKSKLSTLVSHHMREEFVDKWKLAKSTSPKLEFYNSIKHDFGLEKYLCLVKTADARKSLTRLRISAHNLFIERGRYEIPAISRADRWCVHCKLTSGNEYVEDEMHVLTECPLYSKARSKFKFSPNTPDELVSSLSDQKITDMQATAIAKTVHAILTTNHCYTEYYKSQDFHSCFGNCIIL